MPRRRASAIPHAVHPAVAGPCASRVSIWFVLLLGLAMTGCRSPGLVGQLCVGESCPQAGACADGSCEQQPECTLERCGAGLCSEAECEALRCAAGLPGPTCPEPCPAGVCPPVCTGESCPATSCDGGMCEPTSCAGVECPAGQTCVGGTCTTQPPDPNTACDGGTCGPMTMPPCDTDAGSCDAPLCETGPCIAAACDDCEPDPGCNEAFPICPSCRNNNDCGKGEANICDLNRGRCVECLMHTQCGAYEPFCIAGECEECRDDDDCVGRGLGRCRDGDCGF